LEQQRLQPTKEQLAVPANPTTTVVEAETEPIRMVTFTAGSVSNHLNYWQTITSDRYVLNIVKGYNIEFQSVPSSYARQDSAISHRADKNSEKLLSEEIYKLLVSRVIEKCTPDQGQFLSPVFLVTKTDGSYRKILNLKKFNLNVAYEHFKMENLTTVCRMIRPGCYMTSIDLKKAYYSILIALDSRKYLRFEWQGNLYQYRCLPNGLSSASRIFTRLMKTLFSLIRSDAADCVFYLDDSLFLADTYEKCLSDTNNAVHILTSAGFSIHDQKSVMHPTHKIRFLGFVIDSKAMKIFLPEEKVVKLRETVQDVLSETKLTVERLAQVIGLIIAYMPAFTYGRLHYRGLEIDKINALKAGGYKSRVYRLSKYAVNDLNWWLKNAESSGAPVKTPQCTLELYTDASQKGYGASLNGQSVGGRWTETETDIYDGNINCLELLAVLYAIQSFCSVLKCKCVCVRSDNVTTVSYINMMGGTHSIKCNEIALRIWNYAAQNGIFLVASYIPGKLNVQADIASRHFTNPDIEIKLCRNIFTDLCCRFSIAPSIDMFASHRNNQLATYASWKPDPKASYVDAFTMCWDKFEAIYLFPPFSVIDRVLDKLRSYKGKALIIFPRWDRQPWFPSMQRLLCNQQVLHNAIQDCPERLKSVILVAGLLK